MATRQLRTLSGGVEGKYLTNIGGYAAKWGRRMYGETSNVVEVNVSRATANAFTRLGRVDGIGDAWFAELHQLKDAAVRIIK